MTDEQRRRRASYQAILDHFDAHPDVWSGKDPAERAVGRWRSLLADVADQAKIQAKDTRGTTRSRDEQVDHVIDLAMPLIYKLRAYALLDGDPELLPLVDVSRTELDEMNDVEMVSELAVITGAARERLDAVDVYEVTADELDTLDAEAEKVLPRQSTRVSAEDAQAVATARLRTLFGKFPPLRTVLDNLVDGVIGPGDFRDGYYQARKVTD